MFDLLKSFGGVVLAGLPSDENSSFLKGAALAPGKIREVLHNGSCNLFSELGIDLGDRSNMLDIGDLAFSKDPEGFGEIERQLAELLEHDVKILALGGDHAVTYPVVRAFARKYSDLNIVQFDAHPDLYHDFDGNALSHASPFARIMDEKLAKRLLQIGIRTLNAHQKGQAKHFKVSIIEARNFSSDIPLNFDGPVYISCDLDVLDPAFAPGVSHHEPGGLSVRDVIDVIHRIESPIVGADIVEFNPGRDFSDITAMVAAKLLKEIAGQMKVCRSIE